MKHAKRLLENEIKEIETYKENGGYKDVTNYLNELKKELEKL